jgi:hypothetical protein
MRIVPRLHTAEGSDPSLLDSAGKKIGELENPMPPSAADHRGEKSKQVIPADIAKDLRSIASRAFRSARPDEAPAGDDEREPLSVLLAPSKAISAAEHFVSDKKYEDTYPDFRETVGSLVQAIEGLEARLTTTNAPPFQQMRNIYAYGGAEFNGLEEKDSAGIALQFRRERLWNGRYSPEALSETLQLWRDLIESARAEVGDVKTPILAERGFVARLALYWKEELKAPLIDSRGSPRKLDSDPKPNRQKGPFAEFVRTAARLIPDEYRRHISWDHAIRSFVAPESQ